MLINAEVTMGRAVDLPQEIPMVTWYMHQLELIEKFKIEGVSPATLPLYRNEVPADDSKRMKEQH